MSLQKCLSCCANREIKSTCHAQILEYHVVPGMSLTSSNLTDGQELQTMLSGQVIKVRHSCTPFSLHSLLHGLTHTDVRK